MKLARAYLFGGTNNITQRANLQVFQNTLVQHVNWANDVNGSAHAAGISVTGSLGNNTTILANHEVILSAGSLKSPTILEASGVGNPAILAAQDIPLKVSLPSVGFNLQDQPMLGILHPAGTTQNFTGYPTFVTFATARDLFGDNVTNVEAYIRSQIPVYARAISTRAAPNATTSAIQEKLLSAQADLIFRDLIPVAEILTAAIDTTVLAPLWNLLPFSRGSVHISTSTETPIIDPNFLMTDWDGIAVAATGRLTRRYLAAGVAAGWAGPEVTPGVGNVTADGSDAEWIDYLRKYMTPNYHPVGTTAMMAGELGGVVDCELKVYGTNNVRVVDAGVFPAQVDGHLTATLYAVAERAADLILAG